MTETGQLNRAVTYAACKYRELDDLNVLHGLPDLHARDWTWAEWSLHLESLARLLRIDADRPSVDRVAVVAANAIALMIAVENAEITDITSGAERRVA